MQAQFCTILRQRESKEAKKWRECDGAPGRRGAGATARQGWRAPRRGPRWPVGAESEARACVRGAPCRAPAGRARKGEGCGRRWVGGRRPHRNTEGGGPSSSMCCRLLDALGGGTTKPRGGECRSAKGGVVPPPSSCRVPHSGPCTSPDRLCVYLAGFVSARRAGSPLGASWRPFRAPWCLSA